MFLYIVTILINILIMRQLNMGIKIMEYTEPKSIEILRDLSKHQQWRPEVSHLTTLVESLVAAEPIEEISKKTGLSHSKIIHITGQFGRWLSQSAGSVNVSFFYEDATKKLVPAEESRSQQQQLGIIAVIPKGFEIQNRRGYKAIASIVWRNPDRKTALQFLSRAFVGQPIVLSQNMLFMVHTFARMNRLGAPDPVQLKAKELEIAKLDSKIEEMKATQDLDSYNMLFQERENLKNSYNVYKDYHLESIVTSNTYLKEKSFRLAALLVKTYELLELYRKRHNTAISTILNMTRGLTLVNKSLSWPSFSKADLAELDLNALNNAVVTASLLTEVQMGLLSKAIDTQDRETIARAMLAFLLKYNKNPYFYTPASIAQLEDSQVYRIACRAGLVFDEDNQEDVSTRKLVIEKLRDMDLHKYIDELAVLGTNAAKSGELEEFWKILGRRDEEIDWVIQLENLFAQQVLTVDSIA